MYFYFFFHSFYFWVKQLILCLGYNKRKSQQIYYFSDFPITFSQKPVSPDAGGRSQQGVELGSEAEGRQSLECLNLSQDCSGPVPSHRLLPPLLCQRASLGRWSSRKKKRSWLKGRGRNTRRRCHCELHQFKLLCNHTVSACAYLWAAQILSWMATRTGNALSRAQRVQLGKARNVYGF